jgi:hypothetical protein
MNTEFSLVEPSDQDLERLTELRVKHSLQFDHEKTVLKYYLLGKGYHRAIKALGFIERIEFRIKAEDRFRKDKVTPSLHHQLRIALMITQLCDLDDEEAYIVAALLHDVQEDRTISKAEIELEFGKEMSEIVWRLTKKFAGEVKTKEEYIRENSFCKICSVVKACDRLDNLCNMIGVFDIPKMIQYTNEAEDVFLKMVKTASKLHPELLRTFTSISQQLKRQIKITRQYIEITKERDKALSELKETEAKHHRDLQDQIKKDQNEIETLANRFDEIMSQERNRETVHDLSFEEKKILFHKVAKLLEITKKPISPFSISRRDMTLILTEMSIVMGVSSLELSNFLSDSLSDGTSV